MASSSEAPKINDTEFQRLFLSWIGSESFKCLCRGKQRQVLMMVAYDLRAKAVAAKVMKSLDGDKESSDSDISESDIISMVGRVKKDVKLSENDLKELIALLTGIVMKFYPKLTEMERWSYAHNLMNAAEMPKALQNEILFSEM